MLWQDAFDIEDCRRFIKFIDSLPLELTPPPKKGEAERVNRMSFRFIRTLCGDSEFRNRSNFNPIKALRRRAFRRSKSSSTGISIPTVSSNCEEEGGGTGG